MRISEYTLLQDAFDSAFGFMLNRIGDELDSSSVKDGRDLDTTGRERLAERCFSEFIIALEEIGVRLDDAVVTRD